MSRAVSFAFIGICVLVACFADQAASCSNLISGTGGPAYEFTYNNFDFANTGSTSPVYPGDTPAEWVGSTGFKYGQDCKSGTCLNAFSSGFFPLPSIKVNTSDDATFATAGGFVVSMWVKGLYDISQTYSLGYMLKMYDPANSANYAWISGYRSSAQTALTQTIVNGTVFNSTKTSTQFLAEGWTTWKHVSLIVSRASAGVYNIYMFINGALFSQTLGVTGIQTTWRVSVINGGFNVSTANTYAGYFPPVFAYVDEVRIHSDNSTATNKTQLAERIYANAVCTAVDYCTATTALATEPESSQYIYSFDVGTVTQGTDVLIVTNAGTAATDTNPAFASTTVVGEGVTTSTFDQCFIGECLHSVQDMLNPTVINFNISDVFTTGNSFTITYWARTTDGGVPYNSFNESLLTMDYELRLPLIKRQTAKYIYAKFHRFYTDSDGSLDAYYRIYFGSGSNYNGTFNSFYDNMIEWTHFAYSYNLCTDITTIYIDGVEFAQSATGSAVDKTLASINTNLFEYLDEVRIFNVSLNAAGVAAARSADVLRHDDFFASVQEVNPPGDAPMHSAQLIGLTLGSSIGLIMVILFAAAMVAFAYSKYAASMASSIAHGIKSKYSRLGAGDDL